MRLEIVYFGTKWIRLEIVYSGKGKKVKWTREKTVAVFPEEAEAHRPQSSHILDK